MDTFQRLIAPFVVVLLGFFASEVAVAQDGRCQQAAAALAQCQAKSAAVKAAHGPSVSKECYSLTGSDPKATSGAYNLQLSDGELFSYSWNGCTAIPPRNPCGDGKSMKTNYAGALLSGMKQCHAVPQPDGSSVQCGFTATPISPPAKNQYGNWQTYITYTEGGDVCSGDGSNGNSWTNSDGSKPADPPPALPVPDSSDTNPPKLCGNESCYDPKNGNYCAQGSSGQICASGPPPGQSGGSCASGGDSTICAGSPQAPKPPATKVPDPPTQTQGTDNYTHADPATGNLYNTTVTTYTTGPGAATSGASSGDTKPPASSSSSGSPPTPKDSTSASGGGDCNNPPNVEGSAALNMVAVQAWHTRCDITKALTPDAPANPTPRPTLNDAWANGDASSTDAPSSGDSVADNANKGLYNQTGMGFATTCPLKDLDLPIMGDVKVHIPFSGGCPVGAWIRGLVIAMALFAAAKITAGGA